MKLIVKTNLVHDGKILAAGTVFDAPDREAAKLLKKGFVTEAPKEEPKKPDQPPAP